MVLTLLYRLAEWHALAKLHMHTDLTLVHLDKSTVVLGNELRHFRDKVCPSYNTVELPREEDAHYRREAKKAASSAAEEDIAAPSATRLTATSHNNTSAPSISSPHVVTSSHSTATLASSAPAARAASLTDQPGQTSVGAIQHTTTTTHLTTATDSAAGAPAASPKEDTKKPKGKRRKWFNLLTYKAHALGDYVWSIRWFGPSGSFSSQPVRSESSFRCHLF